MHENTYGSAWEDGSVVLQAEAGDVFIIPVGVAHKTHDTNPDAELALLSPGTGHCIEAENPAEALSKIQLESFTMMGAYSGGEWDFIAMGGDFEKMWSVPKPRLDPVWKAFENGLRGKWQGSGWLLKLVSEVLG